MQPSGYLIPVGQRDNERLNALGAIYNETSLGWLPQKFQTLLDVGCGNGCLTKLFSEKHPSSSIVGIDLSPEQIEVAQRLGLKNVTWEERDLFSPDERLFDVVHTRFVLSHIPRVEEALDCLLSQVAPGGTLVLEEKSERSTITLHGECKPMAAWLAMVKLQHQMQQSHPNTHERIVRHLQTKEGLEVRTYSTAIQVSTAAQKALYRIGVEHGIDVLGQMGKSALIKTFGYESGKEWLAEMEAFERDDTQTLTIGNFTCVTARLTPRV